MKEDLEKMHKILNLLFKDFGLVKKRLRHFSLNDLEAFILINMAYMEEVTQKSLCMKLKAPKTTINSSIKNLEDKGLINLVLSDKDKRKKILVLTEKGDRHRREILKPINESNLRIYKDLGEENVENIIKYLTMLTEAIGREYQYLKEK
ncbi:MAG: MarR family winged helix-turn-helix transcriptional regulator [Anaerococcus sp.]|nr:MarR family winged helix-turn-helix transcriptional regulator [Anaerococcus sp.]